MLFILNNEKRRSELNKQYGPHFINNKCLKNKILILKAKTWITSTLELPIGGLGYRIRREVLHMGHGMPFKRIVYQEKQLSLVKKMYYLHLKTNINTYLASSEYFLPIIRDTFKIKEHQIKVLPQPKIDAVLGKIKHYQQALKEAETLTNGAFKKGNINILYAPTWRHYGNISLFPFNIPLTEINTKLQEQQVIIWVREHPLFKTKEHFENLSHIHSFSNEQFDEISEYLQIFNGLITDYSSIALDFLALERPILHLQHDIKTYEEVTGLIESYHDLQPSKAVTDFKGFLNGLSIFQDTPSELQKCITTINKRANLIPENGSATQHILKSLKINKPIPSDSEA